MTVNLGMPATPPPVLASRRPTRQIRVGKVLVGGDAPISVQSMTTTKTTDINGTLQQIAELTATGCDIVRVAVPSQDDADVLHIIAKKSQIPVIADIHFQPKYVYAAIDAGCAAVRVNPGNIRQFDDQVKQIARAASDAGAFGQLVIVGSKSDMAWVHVSLPQMVTPHIVAEIEYPLLSGWFKQPLPMPQLTQVLESLFAR